MNILANDNYFASNGEKIEDNKKQDIDNSNITNNDKTNIEIQNNKIEKK